jgi:hypothetical protein
VEVSYEVAFFNSLLLFFLKNKDIIVGDSPRGPLNNRGKPTSSRKNAKRGLIHEPKERTH